MAITTTTIPRRLAAAAAAAVLAFAVVAALPAPKAAAAPWTYDCLGAPASVAVDDGTLTVTLDPAPDSTFEGTATVYAGVMWAQRFESAQTSLTVSAAASVTFADWPTGGTGLLIVRASGGDRKCHFYWDPSALGVPVGASVPDAPPPNAAELCQINRSNCTPTSCVAAGGSWELTTGFDGGMYGHCDV